MSKVIIGTLHTARDGYWFECADESAGTDANIFDSEAEARKALDELGWDAEIHDLEEIKKLGVTL